ncbi:MAG: hypothetical protein ABI239_11425 [Aquihabitans sp.]
MSDDGAYASQVRLAESGDWGYHDGPSWGTPSTSRPTLGKSSVVDGVEYPYIKHPAWIHVLRAADQLNLPILGMCVVNVLAAVVAAVVAGHLAGPSRLTSVIAFWTVALGPPLVWSLGLWAHAVACALGAVIAWCMVRWREQGQPGWVVAAALAVSCLVLVRTEGMLLVPAVGAVLALHAWERRRDGRALASAVVAGFGVLAAASAARAMDLRLVGSVAPGAEIPAPTSDHPWLAGRWSGFEATFLSGGFNHRDYTVGVLALFLVAVGAATWRRRPAEGIGAVVVGAGVVLVAARAVMGWDQLIQGFFAAAPALAFGLVGIRWTRGSVKERTLVVFAATYGAAVIATQYPDGGATEWGGRFLAPVVVPLAVLASMGVSRFVETSRGRAITSRSAVLAITTLLIVLPVLPALGSTNSNRSTHAAVVADLRSADVDAAIGTFPTLPLLLWPTIGEVPWTVTGPEASEQLPALVERALQTGEERLAVVGYTVDPSEVEGLGYEVEQRSRHILVLTVEQ